MRIALLAISLLTLTISCSSCISQQQIFHTFADKNQVNSLSIMAYDGNTYWFGAQMGGNCYKYTPKTNALQNFNFNRGNVIDSVSGIAIVNGDVWFGLYSAGVGVHYHKQDDFKFYTVDDGVAGYVYRNRKYNRVSAIAYDKDAEKVWVGTIETGLCYFDLKLKKWFVLDDPLIKKIDINSITVNRNLVIVAAEQGLYSLNKKDNVWQFLGSISADFGLEHLVLTENDIIGDIGRNIGEGKFKGIIVKYDLKEKAFANVLEWPDVIDSLQKYNNYLVFCSRKGLTFFNTKTKKYIIFDTSYGLISNWANYVFFDYKDIWVLTQDGISKTRISDVTKALKEIN